MRHRLEDAVTGRQLLRLLPPRRSPDQVVASAGELRPPVAAGFGDRESQKLIGATVVEPVDDLPGDDGVRLGVVGEDLDGQALVDDPADLLLRPVGEGDPCAVVKASEENAYLFSQLIDKYCD